MCVCVRAYLNFLISYVIRSRACKYVAVINMYVYCYACQCVPAGHRYILSSLSWCGLRWHTEVNLKRMNPHWTVCAVYYYY